MVEQKRILTGEMIKFTDKLDVERTGEVLSGQNSQFPNNVFVEYNDGKRVVHETVPVSRIISNQ